MRNKNIDRRGLTLIELLIASVLLMICGFPVMLVFKTSTATLQRSDERRESAFYIDQIFTHLNRTSLHFLWDNFGPPTFTGAGKMRDRIAETDENGQLLVIQEANPLGFSQEFLSDLARDGYEARIRYEFFTQKALRSSSSLFFDIPDERIGILHMQAGWAKVVLYDRESVANGAPVEVSNDVRVIMCPAIVGRPGMKLSSCPALSTTVKAQYGPLLAQREAALGANPPW